MFDSGSYLIREGNKYIRANRRKLSIVQLILKVNRYTSIAKVGNKIPRFVKGRWEQEVGYE